MKTLNLSIGLFAGTASLGAYLANQVFQGKETRKGVALMHGPLAATALGLLLYTARKEKRTDLLAPAAIFVAAGLGGAYLFIRDVMGKKPQTSVTAIHATAAVAGFSLLVRQAWLGGSGREKKQINQNR